VAERRSRDESVRHAALLRVVAKAADAANAPNASVADAAAAAADAATQVSLSG